MTLVIINIYASNSRATKYEEQTQSSRDNRHFHNTRGLSISPPIIDRSKTRKINRAKENLHFR